MSDLGPFLASTMDYWRYPLIALLAYFVLCVFEFVAAVTE